MKKLFVLGYWSIVLLFVFLIHPNIVSPVLAQSTTPSSTNFAKDYHAPEHAAYTLLNLQTAALPCALIGTPLAPKQKCPEYKENGDLALFDQIPNGGAIGGLNTIMVAMYTNPPVSTGQYLASIKENLGFARPAYAQNIKGSGNGVIQPVIKLWELARNISYLAFILVFVVVGFMIMFRQKLSQQAVVSVQAALPGLIIGLILVTFSYLISAFIIDLSFVGMALVAVLFSEPFSGLKNIIADPATTATNANVFSLFGSFTWNGQLFEFMPAAVKLFTSTTAGLGAAFSPSDLINPTGLIGKAAVQVTSAALGGVVGILVILILLIALFVQMFRLIWKLVSCYIAILVITVTSPFIILISSIPGRSGVLALWWKSLLGNILVFPAVFAAFMFAGVFLTKVRSTSFGPFGSGDFQTALPLFAGIPVEVLKLIIGYGIILGTPSVPEMVKKALGVPDIQGIPQSAISGLVAGVGASTPVATGTGRAGIRFVEKKTATATRPSFGYRVNRLINRQFGNNQWFNR